MRRVERAKCSVSVCDSIEKLKHTVKPFDDLRGPLEPFFRLDDDDNFSI